MTRLVVLGCGYVGRAVAMEGLRRGMRVQALTRNPDKAAELRSAGVEAVVGQLQENGWHNEIEPGAEMVVNSVSSGGRGLEGFRESYVEGQRSIVEWCKIGAPGFIAYTSSTSVYPQDGGIVVDESMPTQDADGSAALLLEAEAVLLETQVASRVFILRLAGIYGPGRHHVLDQIRRGGPLPGSGEHHLNLIHRDDCMGAIFRAYDSAHGGGVFNICDDDPTPKAEVAAWLAEQVGQPAPVFDPSIQGPRAARRGSGKMPDRRMSNAKAKAELDWVPMFPSFRDGYRKIFSEENREEVV